MHAIPELFRKTCAGQIAILLFFSFVLAAPVPLRLDLYDASDNHLLYMTFRYDGAGRNTGRTIFMPDETFMRDIAINYDNLGRRLNEVSYDFNGDTIYVTDYSQADNGTTFGVQDQFDLDVVGDRVGYTNADPLNFILTYQHNNVQTATMTYTKDVSTGQLGRVAIAGQSSKDSYYGLFSYGEAMGVVPHTVSKDERRPQVSIQSRISGIAVHFNLHSTANVRCELLTLSGRRAEVLLNGMMQKGTFTRQLTLHKGADRIADGVYLFKVSVDGASVLHSKYLHQSSRAGGVR